MTKKKIQTSSPNYEAITRRLDALIRLTVESRNGEHLTETTTARILKSVGLTPTEIAKILGKKSATDVAPYLYGKISNKESKHTSKAIIGNKKASSDEEIAQPSG